VLQDDLPDPMAVARRELGDKAADVGPVEAVVLKEGPRSKKLARYMPVMNRHTGEVHHHALTLETGKKIQGSWELDDKHSIGFSDEGPDEIGALLSFLHRVRGVPAPTGELFDQLLAIAHDVDALRRLVKQAKGKANDLAGIVAALELGRRNAALEQLTGLEAPHDLQRWLEANRWLLGLEYAELLDRDAGLLLYRRPDDALELVAVEGSLGGAPLFTLADQAFVPVPELTQALGRVMGYVQSRGEPGLRARLIIGTAGDGEQQVALARFNAHLRDVEVFTHDRLAEIGERVLEALREAAREASRPRPQ
jgi:hypothetical protein